MLIDLYTRHFTASLCLRWAVCIEGSATYPHKDRHATYPILMGNSRKILSRNLQQYQGDLSQVQFARKLRIAQSTMNRIMNEEQNVTIDMLDHLSKRLKIESADLVRAPRVARKHGKK